jgi:hypothetical protein
MDSGWIWALVARPLAALILFVGIGGTISWLVRRFLPYKIAVLLTTPIGEQARRARRRQ